MRAKCWLNNNLPSDFNNHLVVEQYTVASGTISANGTTGLIDYSVSKAGYYPVAIAGTALNGGMYLYTNYLMISHRSSGSVTITYMVNNRDESNSRDYTLFAQVLWRKVIS